MKNVVEAGDDTDTSAGVFDGSGATVYYEDNLLIPANTPLNDDNISMQTSRSTSRPVCGSTI